MTEMRNFLSYDVWSDPTFNMQQGTCTLIRLFPSYDLHVLGHHALLQAVPFNHINSLASTTFYFLTPSLLTLLAQCSYPISRRREA